MATYEATTVLAPALKGKLNAYLQMKKPIDGVKGGDPIHTFTVHFPNGVEADVKVVNGCDDCGPWGEIVLFDANGNEVGLTEPCLESVDGDTTFELDGDCYILNVK